MTVRRSARTAKRAPELVAAITEPAPKKAKTAPKKKAAAETKEETVVAEIKPTAGGVRLVIERCNS